MKSFCLFFLILILFSCKDHDSLQGYIAPSDTADNTASCSDANYVNWQISSYVLPYEVGTSYRVDLNQCSSSYHAPGQPDQFAVDFFMNIGTPILASRGGRVTFVEESGQDFGFPNNKVIIEYGGDFDQYMHLTQDGAVVVQGQNVVQGQLIGYSGATGLAGYPHLHFVVTRGGWEYPYSSVPHNYKNTTANPMGPAANTIYEALPY
jgi:murein DD-endopeptidase MepM/ murein hydrolase activator NlpD